jgi:RNA polymerase sigma factor (sigma-70 family)
MRSRPTRAEVEPAALDLISRHGADIMATARRYASSPEDAEDAYQRSLEILLTKAPSTREDDLVPWLKTVVKHEAFALYRQRERNGEPTDRADVHRHETHQPDTHDQVERLERLQVGAEALSRLKPQEMRCMLLLAEGHSYRQICEITGFTYTKVNRCLTEGRRSFMQRVERIESGAECERLAPLISAMADGEASAKDMAMLRPHLRTCLACRAALRDAREAPARVAALAPLGLLAGSQAHGSALRSLTAWLHERSTALFLRGQDVIEAASAHKLAAAASVAALGGGGIATVEVREHHHHRAARHAAAQTVGAPAWRPAAKAVPPAVSRVPSARPAPRSEQPPKRERVRWRPKRASVEPAAPVAVEPAARIAPSAAHRDAPVDRTPAPAEGSTGEFGP